METKNLETFTETLRATLLQSPNFSRKEYLRGHGKYLIDLIDKDYSNTELNILTDTASEKAEPGVYLRNRLERLMSKYSKGGNIETDNRKLVPGINSNFFSYTVNLDILYEKLEVYRNWSLKQPYPDVATLDTLDPIPYTDLAIYSIYLELKLIQRLKDELGHYPENPKIETPIVQKTGSIEWNHPKTTFADILRQLRELKTTDGKSFLEATDEQLKPFEQSRFSGFDGQNLLIWNGQVNTFDHFIYQLKEIKNANGRPIFSAKGKTTIARFLYGTFDIWAEMKFATITKSYLGGTEPNPKTEKLEVKTIGDSLIVVRG